MAAYEHKWIANFWIRIGALLIDSLLLAIIGIVLSFFLKDAFIQLGFLGRIVGFAIALIYFAVLNSRIAGGQTLGKKVLHLRVVDEGNEPISFVKSLSRYLVLGVPVFLSGMRLPDFVSSSWLAYPLALIVIGGSLSSVYLYVFNRRTRQTLHDLMTGTYVVYVDVDKPEVRPVWQAHLAFVCFLFIFSIMFPFTAKRIAPLKGYESLLDVQSSLVARPGISAAIVSVGVNTIHRTHEEPEKVSYVIAQVFLDQDRLMEAALAENLAQTIVDLYPEAAGKDTLRIVLVYGFDIGIWSHWLKQAYDFNPAHFVADEL
ncbi:RDD family protein [Reinekea marinisedimentorum]|uniref:Putative RDD family membrane protein YckC n=1 Tax=Reinekea marinisedimentorum TaxID=230495 RepID=A0A4V2UJ70_9GAMM|nr:RDD family protein [Reinekea marinisedimentorum]TCS38900.1 putative RDD family membrane protein YckC [Reinekea marinisedimentorum]